jgi:WD40 repeat protein
MSRPIEFLLPIDPADRPRLEGSERVMPSVTAAEFSGDGRLAVGTIDGMVRVWRLVLGSAPGDPERRLKHEAPATMLRFSPNSNWLAAKPDSVDDGWWAVSEPSRRPQLHDLTAPEGAKSTILSGTDAKELLFTDDSNWLLIRERRLDIWSLQSNATGNSRAVLVGSEPGVSVMKAVTDGAETVLLSGHDNGSIGVRRLVPGEVPNPAYTLLWHESPVTHIFSSPSQRWLASFAADRSAAQWRFRQGWRPLAPDFGVRETIELSDDQIAGVHVDPKGRQVVIQTRHGPLVMGPIAMPGGVLPTDLYPKVGYGYYSSDSWCGSAQMDGGWPPAATTALWR